MNAIRIDHLERRYRLPASRTDAARRLDRLIGDGADGVLEAALLRAGIGTNEEVCIPRVGALLRTPLSASDDAVATAWSIGFVDAVVRALAAGEAVRYRSRADALVDLVVSCSAGDDDRAWAWRQLGLWGRDAPSGPRAMVAAALRTLLTEPAAIVPVIVEATRVGALGPLLAHASEQTWGDLAAAAAGAVGARLFVPDDPGVEPTTAVGSTPLATTDATSSHVARVVARSHLARHVREAGLVTSPAERRAFAVLSIIEADPVCLRRPSAIDRLVHEVEVALFPPTSGSPARSPHGSSTASPTSRQSVRGVRPPVMTKRRRATATGDDPRSRPPVRSPAAAPDPIRTWERPPTSPTDASWGDAANVADTSAPHVEGSAGSIQPNGDERQRRAERDIAGSEDVRGDVRGLLVDEIDSTFSTHAGGLLFLLHFVGALGLPDVLVADPIFATRSLRWILHQLAILLLALDEADPAALAFAGLGPTAVPPSRYEPSAEAAEHDRLDMIGEAIVDALAERLKALDEPRGLLLRRVCLRRGHVVASPGWIEMHLAIDQVSTDVRRVGLDLDPQWLPWLGVVVRFVYA